MTTATRPRGGVDRPYVIDNHKRSRATAANLNGQHPDTATAADWLTNSRTDNQPKKKKRRTGPPCYVTAEQARAIISIAKTTSHRLLIEALWQSGGRITEVLKLRPCDLDANEGALRMVNQKQRSEYLKSKHVYVSPALVSDLQRLAADNRCPVGGYLFPSKRKAGYVSRQYAWRLVNGYATAAGVQVLDDDQLRPANARDFRHGAAVHQIRQGVALTEIQQQLGHTSVGSTSIYTKLANPERRAMADRVKW